MKSEIKNIVYIDGKFYMKVNVVMLTTNKKAHFGDIILTPTSPKTLFIFQHQNCTEVAQYFYITSDEEIKEGDWVYENNLSKERIYLVYKRNNSLCFFRFRNVPIWFDKNSNSARKIIATTNTSLYFQCDCCNGTGIIEDKPCRTCIGGKLGPLPQPSQQFIEKYIEEYNNGKIITDVLVEYEEVYQPYFENKEFHRNATKYQLKVNFKDNTITIKK